jgi:hypothetical protein
VPQDNGIGGRYNPVNENMRAAAQNAQIQAAQPKEIKMPRNRLLYTLVAITLLGIAALTGWKTFAGKAVAQANLTMGLGAVESNLTATVGQGAGQVVVAPTSQDHGTFEAEITVTIDGAAPNTTFNIVRAPDLTPNGLCTGSYIPFGQTLTTSADGSGALHFSFHKGSPLVSGVKFDVAFRALGSDGTILQGNCMTVTVK